MLRLAPFLLLAGCSSLLGIDSLDVDNDGGAVDAAALPDVTVPPIDGPAALTGLGAPCNSAPDCTIDTVCVLVANGLPGFCTGVCADDVVFMTDANGDPNAFDPNPAEQDSVCVGLFNGGIGTPSCALIQNLNPPLPLEPDTAYTADFFCVLRCQVDADCPAELSCDTTVGGACLPRNAP